MKKPDVTSLKIFVINKRLKQEFNLYSHFLLHATQMKHSQKHNLNITSQKLSIFNKVPVSGEGTKTENIVFSTRKKLTNTVLNVNNEKKQN